MLRLTLSTEEYLMLGDDIKIVFLEEATIIFELW